MTLEESFKLGYRSVSNPHTKVALIDLFPGEPKEDLTIQEAFKIGYQTFLADTVEDRVDASKAWERFSQAMREGELTHYRDADQI